MNKIKKITLDDEFIKMEFDDNELSIPRNQDYVKKYMSNALSESHSHLKNSKFYKFGAKICYFAMIYSISLFLGCYLADFLLIDFMAIFCGGLGGFSLFTYSLFKLADTAALERAYNNEYWLKIRDTAVNNVNKVKEQKKQKVVTKTIDSNKNVKTNTFYNNLTEEKEITKSGRKL